MIITGEMIISGFVSKIVNDCGDILKNKIKDADKDRKSSEKNMETKIYQVLVDALNGFSYNEHKKKEMVYDAAESVLKQLKVGKDNYIDAVKPGLKIVISEVTDDICKSFLDVLCYEICQKENRDLAIEVIILQQEQTKEFIQQEFRKSYLNNEEINRKLDYLIKDLIDKKVQEEQCNSENPIENRAEEYAGKWDKNVFLNNFNERDENCGVNIKLNSIYFLPHYIWKTNVNPSFDLEKLLCEYIVDNNSKKMLLILGQPGIGKSTLITWIMAKLKGRKNDFFVYQFAPDLEKVDWKKDDILNDMFKTLNFKYDELENKVLILDGFDEVHTNKDRKSILNQIYQELLRKTSLKNFSLIITCREKYIYDLLRIECDYITLQRWNSEQIQGFCRKYENVSKCSISKNTINKILENEKIFGIPLILYMVLALEISVEKNSSIVDIYDQIFSMDGGGIYDRCIKNSRYAMPHRIGEFKIKQQIHQISQRIAFWIFENKPEEAFITKLKYEEICDDVVNKVLEKNEDIKRDFLIANYFEPIKHCEGVGTDELHFVHRSIYEYFVSVYFFESIQNLTTKEEMAGKFGELLKEGHLSKQILEYIKYKFDTIKNYNLSDTIKEVLNLMLQDGMTYYIGKPYKNVIKCEMNIFSNMLEVVRLWNFALGELNDKIIFYLACNKNSKLNLRGINLFGANLKGADLVGADFEEANLIGVNLTGVDLTGANLTGANLTGANLFGADLAGANLTGANLFGANLFGANLFGANLIEVNLMGAELERAELARTELTKTKFDEEQARLLCEKYDLRFSRIYISEICQDVSYEKYVQRITNWM